MQISTWRHQDGTVSTYVNPFIGGAPKTLWQSPDGSLHWLERAYLLSAGSWVKMPAGAIRGEGEIILAGWRRVTAHL